MSSKNIDKNLKIVSMDVKDIRWPTSLGSHGSDAMVFHNIFTVSNYIKLFQFESSIFVGEIFSTPIQIIRVLM